MPRYVQIPPDIKFIIKTTGKPQMEEDPETREVRQVTVSFHGFFFGVLIHHPVMSTVVGGRALYKFEQAYDEAMKSDKIMVIDEDVWDLFKKAFDKPTYHAPGPYGPQVLDGFRGYNGAGVMQLLPFIDVFNDPPTKKPHLTSVEAQASTA